MKCKRGWKRLDDSMKEDSEIEIQLRCGKLLTLGYHTLRTS